MQLRRLPQRDDADLHVLERLAHGLIPLHPLLFPHTRALSSEVHEQQLHEFEDPEDEIDVDEEVDDKDVEEEDEEETVDIEVVEERSFFEGFLRGFFRGSAADFCFFPAPFFSFFPAPFFSFFPVMKRTELFLLMSGFSPGSDSAVLTLLSSMSGKPMESSEIRLLVDRHSCTVPAFVTIRYKKFRRSTV